MEIFEFDRYFSLDYKKALPRIKTDLLNFIIIKHDFHMLKISLIELFVTNPIISAKTDKSI